MFELLKDCLKAIFTNCMCLFGGDFFILQMVLVIAFGQKSISILLVSSVQPRSDPKTSFTLVFHTPPPPPPHPTPFYLVSGLHIGLLCVTISHAVLMELHSLLFSKNSKRCLTPPLKSWPTAESEIAGIQAVASAILQKDQSRFIFLKI